MHFWVATRRLRICCTATTYKQPCLYVFMKFKYQMSVILEEEMDYVLTFMSKMKHWENTMGMKLLAAYSRYREDNCLYLAGTLNRAKLASTVYNKIRIVINKS